MRRRFGLILMQHVMSAIRVPVINVNITRPGIGRAGHSGHAQVAGK